MDPPPIQYVKTDDGVSIAYISVGAGPPLVFASNIFGDAHLYRASWPPVRGVTNRLAGLGWRVIRYDHRGMGASDRTVDDLSLAARVADLEAVVERLNVPRVALAGADFGAATAVAYAARHLEQVSHLILLSPWRSGARRFAIPDVRVAMSMTPAAGREW